MRRAFAAVCWTGLFLLMLSALVVIPSEEAPQAPPPPPSHYHAVFMPMPEAAAAAAVQANPRWDMRLLAVIAVCMAPLLILPHERDANGRIISASRYVQSVYQVFRPEMAGG